MNLGDTHNSPNRRVRKLLCGLGHSLFLCAVIAYIAVSCSIDRDTEKLISEAEKIVSSEPQRAIEIMSSIDRSELYDDAAFARYALVYSEALYYGQVNVNQDTLTRPMIDYYLGSKNHAERARAFYQHALVLSRMDEYPEAMLSLMTAEESLAKSPNHRLAGLVCRNKGYIYGADCLFENSYAEHKKSIDHFTKAGLEEHRAFAVYDMADALANLHQYEEAERYFLESFDYAVEFDNKHMLCGIMHGLCDVYISMDEFAKCDAILALFDEYDCLVYYVSNYYCLKAIVEADKGNYEEAEEYARLAEQCADADETNIQFTHYAVNRIRGDYREALLWHEQSKLNQDSLMRQILRQSVLNVQVELLQNGVDKERREAELKGQRNMILWLSFIILVVIISIYLRYRWVARERDIASYMQTIKELGGNAENLKREVHELYKDRFADFNRMCETYYQHGNTPREASKVFEDVKSIIEQTKNDDQRIGELERIVNLQYDNIVQRMRSACPKLTDREIKLVLYSYAGFSARTISIFMDSDLAALSRLKYKIKTKLNECNFSDAQEVLCNTLCR